MSALTLNHTELEVWKIRNSKTDEDLAQMLGVTATTLSRWRKGKSAVPLAAAMALERITEIPLRTLFLETGAKTAEQYLERNGLADASAAQQKAG